jgi:energy-converting hydrogenase Eha subunit C
MDAGSRRIVSMSEARELLGGIGHTMLYDPINAGQIVKVNVGRRGFVTTESIDAYVDRITAAALADMAAATA